MNIASRWEGAIDVSSDRLPVVGTLAGTRVHYAAGFTGNGVGPSWLVGKTLARLALREDVNSPLLAGRAPALPPEPLRSFGAKVVRRALLAIDDAETGGKSTPRWASAIRRARARRAPRRLPLTCAARRRSLASPC